MTRFFDSLKGGAAKCSASQILYLSKFHFAAAPGVFSGTGGLRGFCGLGRRLCRSIGRCFRRRLGGRFCRLLRRSFRWLIRGRLGGRLCGRCRWRLRWWLGGFLGRCCGRLCLGRSGGPVGRRGGRRRCRHCGCLGGFFRGRFRHFFRRFGSVLRGIFCSCFRGGSALCGFRSAQAILNTPHHKQQQQKHRHRQNGDDHFPFLYHRFLTFLYFRDHANGEGNSSDAVIVIKMQSVCRGGIVCRPAISP